jgi:hypothetical protein
MRDQYPKSWLVALGALIFSFAICGIYYLCDKYVEGEPNLEEE